MQSVASFDFSNKEYDLMLKLDDGSSVFRAKMVSDVLRATSANSGWLSCTVLTGYSSG